MVGNGAFLMKDVVLFAVSCYLLKQDLVKATLAEAIEKQQMLTYSHYEKWGRT